MRKAVRMADNKHKGSALGSFVGEAGVLEGPRAQAIREAMGQHPEDRVRELKADIVSAAAR